MKDAESIIALIMIGAPATFLTGMTLYRFKVLLLFSSKVFLLRPFRFHSKSIQANEIVTLNWKLWETHKLGDFRQIEIWTNNYNFEISDLEFANFNSLQHWIINQVSFSPNLDQKRTIEIEEAKSNTWINRIVIGLLGFFLLMLLTTLNLSSPRPIKLVVIGLISFLIYRLTMRLRQYGNWSAKYRKVRKKRLRTLKERNKHNRVDGPD